MCFSQPWKIKKSVFLAFGIGVVLGTCIAVSVLYIIEHHFKGIEVMPSTFSYDSHNRYSREFKDGGSSIDSLWLIGHKENKSLHFRK